MRIKAAGCRVDVSSVYDGNYDNIYNLTKWCIENKIRIKILEPVVDEIAEQPDFNYIKMRDNLLTDFHLEKN